MYIGGGSDVGEGKSSFVGHVKEENKLFSGIATLRTFLQGELPASIQAHFTLSSLIAQNVLKSAPLLDLARNSYKVIQTASPKHLGYTHHALFRSYSSA